MGHNQACDKCGKRNRWDAGVIIHLKGNISIDKFGIVYPYCNNRMIIMDDFNEGSKPEDKWEHGHF